jgi:hypothetical protein
VDNREKNFTHGRVKKPKEAIEQIITCYLSNLDRADRQVEVTGGPVLAQKFAVLNPRVDILRAKNADAVGSGNEAHHVGREPDLPDRS